MEVSLFLKTSASFPLLILRLLFFLGILPSYSLPLKREKHMNKLIANKRLLTNLNGFQLLM